MAEGDSGERRDRYQRAGAAAGGALVGGVIGGPAGAIAGAALGPLLEPLARQVWTELSASGQQRMDEVLASACDAGIPPDELSDRINASDRTQLLTGYALAAATRTAWQDKLRTLGRSLASGLLAEDDAQVDTEQMIIAAIADIEAPQLSLLEFLVRWEPGHTVGRPPVDGPLDIPLYSYGFVRGAGWHVRNRAWTIEQTISARPRGGVNLNWPHCDGADSTDRRNRVTDVVDGSGVQHTTARARSLTGVSVCAAQASIVAARVRAVP